MNKMKNTQRYTKLTALILILTLGVFILKNYIMAPIGGFKWASPLDILLLLPAIPFWKLFSLLPLEPTWFNLIITFGGTSLFWLIVAYIIGYRKDKKIKINND